MFIPDYVAMEIEVQSSPPPPQENGSKIEESPEIKPKTRRGRSRSKSPQKKKEPTKKCDFNPKVVLEVIEETLNGQKEQEASKRDKTEESPKSDKDTKEVRRSSRRTKVPDVVETNGQEAEVEEAESSSQNTSVESEEQQQQSDVLTVEMDPLVLDTDEPDPELEFDEAETDKESGKGSPALSRCKTRRSHSRQISTPKTPKSGTDDSGSERNTTTAAAVAPPTPVPETLPDLSDSSNAIDDSSIRAQLGSDSSRLDFTADDTYLNYSRERSFNDIVRSLSGRKTFRPVSDTYRLKALRNNRNNKNSDSSNAVQMMSGGRAEDSPDNREKRATKRKRSASPVDRKKFKVADTEFGSYLSVPLRRIRHSFRADGDTAVAATGTPTLTAYKDDNRDLRGDASYAEEVTEDAEGEKKNWCALM